MVYGLGFLGPQGFCRSWVLKGPWSSWVLPPLGSSRVVGPCFPVCHCVHFLKGFYFDVYKLLNANAFVYMYNKLKPNAHYNANTLKIVSKPYLDYYSGEYSN